VYEEKDNEESRSQEVGYLEEFVESITEFLVSLLNIPPMLINIPNDTNGHDVQVCLRDQGSNTSPVNHACFPLHHHVSFLDVNHYEWECVNQSQHKHCPTRPTVEHHKFLI
jgi:hypothetical protein